MAIVFRSFALCLLAVFAVSSARAQPSVPPHIACKPTFLLAHESFFGGTAFVARVPGGKRNVLVTCHHLFGPATGRDEQMSGADVARDVVGVAGVSLTDGRTVLTAGPALAVPEARPLDERGCDRDVALFLIPPPVPPATASASLPLATRPARTGDRVWLLFRVRGRDAPGLYRAKITNVSPAQVEFEFAETELELRGSSGAPLLNDAGDVVAVNVGGGREGRRLVGMGCPSAAVLAVIGRRLE